MKDRLEERKRRERETETKRERRGREGNHICVIKDDYVKECHSFRKMSIFKFYLYPLSKVIVAYTVVYVMRHNYIHVYFWYMYGKRWQIFFWFSQRLCEIQLYGVIWNNNIVIMNKTLHSVNISLSSELMTLSNS